MGREEVALSLAQKALSESATGIENIIANSEFNGTTSWGAASGTNAVANGELTFTPSAITGSHGPNQLLASANLGEKIYSCMEIYSAKSGQVVYHQFYGATRKQVTTVGGSWVKSSVLATLDTTIFNTLFTAYRQSTNVSDLTDTFKIRKPLLINLTKTFGVGNEPTLEEMETLLSKIPASWWSGTLKNNNITRALYDIQRDNLKTLNAKADQAKVNSIDKALFKAYNLVPNGNFSKSPSGWTTWTASESVINSELVVNVTTQFGNASKTIPFVNTMRGQQFFFRAKVKAVYSEAQLQLVDSVATTVSHSGNGEYVILSGLKTITQTATSLTIRIVDTKASGRSPIYIDDVIVLNLTETFGKNTPTLNEINEIIEKMDNKYIDEAVPVMSMKDLYDSQSQFREEVNMNSLPFIMPSFKSPRRPMITITYDDESVNIYDYAFPIHKAENVPGTFYVVSSRIGTGKLYDWGIADTWDRIKEMDKSGVMKIECHSYAHNYLPSFNRAALEADFSNSIKLFRRQGITIKHISYPGGYYNDLVQQVAQQYFQSGRTTGRDPVTSYQGHLYDIKPYAIDAMGMDGNLAAAKTKVDQALANNCWMNFFMHSVHPDRTVNGTSGTFNCLTPAELTELIQYAKSKGVEIVSVDEALRTYAPIFCWIDDQANSPMVIKRDSTIAYNVQGYDPFLMP